MTSLVSLYNAKPGAWLFLISLRVFVTSYVIISGKSDESGLVLFSEGCWSWSVELYSFCVKACADLQYVINFLHFCFHLSFSLVLCICFGPQPL